MALNHFRARHFAAQHFVVFAGAQPSQATTAPRGGGSAGATTPLRVYRNYGGGLKLSPWMLLSGGGAQQFGSPAEEVAPAKRTKREVFRAEYPITGHLQQYLSAKEAAEQRAGRVAQAAIAKAAASSRKQEEQDIMMFMAMLAAMEDDE